MLNGRGERTHHIITSSTTDLESLLKQYTIRVCVREISIALGKLTQERCERCEPGANGEYQGVSRGFMPVTCRREERDIVRTGAPDLVLYLHSRACREAYVRGLNTAHVFEVETEGEILL